jgi:hypothetical protein
MNAFVRSLAKAAAFASVVLGIIGCAKGPTFAEVEGVVTKNGNPLGNVKVEFWPVMQGPVSSGVTDASGKYTLKANDGAKVGAVVGEHVVLLRDLDMLGTKFLGRKAENVADMSGGKKNRIPIEFSDVKNAKLKVTVSAGSKNTHDLKVN